MEHLCCQICKDVFNDPVTILCGHSFCMRCIQSRWSAEERTRGFVSCPECKREFPLRSQLVQNQTLTALVADMRMSVGAQNETERRSTSDSDNPQPTNIPRSATSTAPELSNSGPMCLKHNKELSLYCYADKQVICSLCAFFGHATHRTGNVSDERREKQEELRIVMQTYKEMLMAQENIWKNLSENHTQIKEGARNAADYCESIFTQLIDTLQRCYGVVEGVVEALKMAAEASLQSSLHSSELNRKALRKQGAELNELASTENDIHFLQKWPSSFYMPDNLAEGSPPQTLLRYEDIKAAVAQLGRQLDEFCCKEIASFSQTFPSTNNEADLEPKTREEFLKYACELTLDPDTANRDLVLSNQNKEVKLWPRERNDRAAHHPERFSRRQVLCKEGLQAARCYYEVEVTGGKAEIALAYKTIDRKSLAPKSAFGATEHSWSLDRSDSYSVSHKGHAVQLTAKPTAHQKIGIYLQFKEGSLSFYDVSETMTLLYKIKAAFTEPLYPGFWLGEKSSIKLCDF